MGSKIYETGNPNGPCKTYSPLLEESFLTARLRHPRRGYKKPPKFAALAALAAAPKESQALTLAGALVAIATTVCLLFFVAIEHSAVEEQYQQEREMELALKETYAAVYGSSESIEDEVSEDEDPPAEPGINEVAMANITPSSIEEEMALQPTEVRFFVLR